MQHLVITLFVLFFTILNHVHLRPATEPQPYDGQLFPDSSFFFPPNSTFFNDMEHLIRSVIDDSTGSHRIEPSTSKCERISNVTLATHADDYVERCVEKVLSADGKSYSTKTSIILYQHNGTQIPLHLAESHVAVETFDHLNQ